jgi:hypothetical protein
VNAREPFPQRFVLDARRGPRRCIATDRDRSADLLVRQWSDDVGFFVHSYDLMPTEQRQLEARGIRNTTSVAN